MSDNQDNKSTLIKVSKEFKISGFNSILNLYHAKGEARYDLNTGRLFCISVSGAETSVSLDPSKVSVATIKALVSDFFNR